MTIFDRSNDPARRLRELVLSAACSQEEWKIRQFVISWLSFLSKEHGEDGPHAVAHDRVVGCDQNTREFFVLRGEVGVSCGAVNSRRRELATERARRRSRPRRWRSADRVFVTGEPRQPDR